MIRSCVASMACLTILFIVGGFVWLTQIINSDLEAPCRIVNLLAGQAPQGSRPDEDKSRDSFCKSGAAALNTCGVTPPFLAQTKLLYVFEPTLRSGFFRQIFKPPIPLT